MTIRALIFIAALAVLSPSPGSAEIVGSVRVSLDQQGNQLAGPSGSAFGSPSLSADGNLVAFESAGQAFTEDANGTSDILLRDMEERTVELVSLADGGGAGNNRSYSPSMSADGRYIAFESFATNLVESDLNSWPDIYLRDRQDGTTTLVSVAPDGAPANGPSSGPVISTAGTFVAFCSRASNLSDDGNSSSDVYVYDIANGTLTRVPPPEGEANEGCRRVALSGGGHFVAYSYISGDGTSQVYRTEVATGSATLVSGNNGSKGNAESGTEGLAITADGETVAFTSRATDLVAADKNGMADVFLWKAADGSLTRVSVGADDTEGDGDSGLLGIDLSGDGRYIVYGSAATNLVANDFNRAADIFWVDSDFGEPKVASATSGDRGANGPSYSPAISDDGQIVAFASLATDVVYGDRNRQPDVFIRGGAFLADAGLAAPEDTAAPAEESPVVVRPSDDDGIPSAAMYGGLAAAVALVLTGGWWLAGRKPRA